MAESILRDKSYNFALRTVKLYQFIVAEKNEFVLSKQILRSGTSIGANVEEASQAQSKRILFTNFQSLKRERLKLIIGSGFCATAII
jgi:four helix bundle protein